MAPVGAVGGTVGSDVGPLGLVGGPHRRPHKVEVDALSLMTRVSSHGRMPEARCAIATRVGEAGSCVRLHEKLVLSTSQGCDRLETQRPRPVRGLAVDGHDHVARHSVGAAVGRPALGDAGDVPTISRFYGIVIRVYFSRSCAAALSRPLRRPRSGHRDRKRHSSARRRDHDRSGLATRDRLVTR